jgi:hypothetical protein
MTALDVFNYAMTLMDEVEDNGTINAGNTAGYKAKTPRLLTMLQQEVARIEGKTATVLTSINDNLVVSDYSAINVLPWGLASLLVIEENEITAPFFNSKYEEMKRTIPVTAVEITDVYGGIDDNMGGW